MPLPTAKTPATFELNKLKILLYGKAKLGKSTLASQFPEAIFFPTEAGLGSVEVYQRPVSNWSDILSAAKEVADGGHQFQTVVLDTVDNAFRWCVDYVCDQNKVKHPSDIPYGKGFALVEAEWHRVLTKLSHLPYGLILISHAQEREVDTRTGKVVKAFPTLNDRAQQVVLGLVDMILYADQEIVVNEQGKQVPHRVLRTKPALSYEAGDRTGRLPDTVDLGFTSFSDAFNAPAKQDQLKLVKGK